MPLNYSILAIVIVAENELRNIILFINLDFKAIFLFPSKVNEEILKDAKPEDMLSWTTEKKGTGKIVLIPRTAVTVDGGQDSRQNPPGLQGKRERRGLQDPSQVIVGLGNSPSMLSACIPARERDKSCDLFQGSVDPDTVTQRSCNQTIVSPQSPAGQS